MNDLHCDFVNLKWVKKIILDSDLMKLVDLSFDIINITLQHLQVVRKNKLKWESFKEK